MNRLVFKLENDASVRWWKNNTSWQKKPLRNCTWEIDQVEGSDSESEESESEVSNESSNESSQISDSDENDGKDTSSYEISDIDTDDESDINIGDKWYQYWRLYLGEVQILLFYGILHWRMQNAWRKIQMKKYHSFSWKGSVDICSSIEKNYMRDYLSCKYDQTDTTDAYN